MPVPVAVTNPTGVGLAGATANVLPSEGPFARLAAARQSEGADAAATVSNGHSASVAPTSTDTCEWSVETQHLDFSYPGIDGRPLPGVPPVVQDMNFRLPGGSTCLLVGPNGAGKTSLLKVLGGKHMVPPGAVRVLGRPPFHDTQLTASGDLSYIGGNWERDVAFAGYNVPLTGDFPASRMLNSLPGCDPARRERLMRVLDIDPDWRMHLVSDGQRRRVQIAMGLLKPFKVLLLDEITVDLDVLGRADLMDFLRQECRERGATIIYATHIFDGLEAWPSHLMYVSGGQVRQFAEAAAFPELGQGRLLNLIERWLREDHKRKLLERAAAAKQAGQCDNDSEIGVLPEWNNGWAPGRLTSSMKHSSNTVMRM